MIIQSSALILLFAAVATAQFNVDRPPVLADHDGRPGCQTRYEFRRLWRNNLVPDQYWECRRWNERAEVRYCPMATRFQDSWQTCIPITQWEWTPYIEPPTRAGVPSPYECEELIIDPPEECNPTTTTSTVAPTGTTTMSTGSTTTETGVTDSTAQPEIIKCAGAHPWQHSSGELECNQGPPSERCSIFIINRRVPTTNPYVFYECNYPNQWVRRTCSNDKCYDPSVRSCVTPLIWRNRCQLWISHNSRLLGYTK